MNLYLNPKKIWSLDKVKQILCLYVNDLVWLKTTNPSFSRPCPKLDYKKTGPFKIVKKLSPVSYELELPSSLNIHNVFHVCLLERFNRRDNEPIPLPNIDLKYDDEHKVKEIISL